MISKTEKVKQLVKNGEYQKALSLARTFRFWSNDQDKKTIQLAAEVRKNSSFYTQIGKDVEAEYQKGVETITRLYGAYN